MSSVDEERTEKYVAELSPEQKRHDEARLAAIRERAEAATAGPWKAPETILGLPSKTVFAGPDSQHVLYFAGRFEDADFAAHARDDIPFLLAALESVSPRLVTTEEEAGSLEEGTILRTDDGLTMDCRGGWFHETGYEMHFGPDEIALPATVLWSPAPEGKN